MILKCNNLTIGYDNHPIIKDINLEIDQGDYVCIFGDNGSGKSTLVKTLLGLTPKLKGANLCLPLFVLRLMGGWSHIGGLALHNFFRLFIRSK